MLLEKAPPWTPLAVTSLLAFISFGGGSGVLFGSKHRERCAEDVDGTPTLSSTILPHITQCASAI